MMSQRDVVDRSLIRGRTQRLIDGLHIHIEMAAPKLGSSPQLNCGRLLVIIIEREENRSL